LKTVGLFVLAFVTHFTFGTLTISQLNQRILKKCLMNPLPMYIWEIYLNAHVYSIIKNTF